MIRRFKRKLSRTKSPVETVPDPDGFEAPTPPSLINLSPSDEELVSRLAFAQDAQIIERAPLRRAASVGTRWSERTVFHNNNGTCTGLLGLPTEILVTLQQYLTPCSEVALRHSCSRFFHLYSTPSFYLKGDDLFEFLCMTERDQDPTELDKLVCGVCHSLHPRQTFPSSEVRQPPRERDCRQVWLCPHRHMGYAKTAKLIKAGVDSPFRAENIAPCNRCWETIRNRSVADRPEKGSARIHLENPRSESLLITKIGLMQAPSPLYNVKARNSGTSGMYKEVFQVKDVSAALQAINFQLCPHLWLGDPPILSKFCRSCINTQKLPPGVKGPHCISESDKKDSAGRTKFIGRCKGSCWASGCRTKFMFQARESLAPDASGRRQIWLIIVIYRWLGPLLTNQRNQTWSDHACKHVDRLKMKENWRDWEKQARQQCMPNWSICLLHPDDCNLR